MRGVTGNKVFNLGCVSHMATLCAYIIIAALHQPVEDLLVDTYYFPAQEARNTKRSSASYPRAWNWKNYSNTSTPDGFHSRDAQVRQPNDQSISQWPVLMAYLESQNEQGRAGRVKRCADNYSRPDMNLIVFFASSQQVQRTLLGGGMSCTTVS